MGTLHCLIHPDPLAEFFLYVDASDLAVGGVLLQQRDGHLVPIEFSSKKLTEQQRRWPTCELETFAVVLFTKHWRKFLLPRRFTIFTDHKNLVALFGPHQCSLNQRLQRWALQLSEMDFVVKYVPGDQNAMADYLSRGLQVPTTASFINQQVVMRVGKQSCLRTHTQKERNRASIGLLVQHFADLHTLCIFTLAT
jgi:hypothetical protein